MKKKIAALAIAATVLLSGCGDTVVNEYGNEVSKLGPYIEISRCEGNDLNGNHHTFVTAYHEESKIVYQLDLRGYGVNIMELHSYDEEGHPVVLLYEKGEIIRKNELHN